ncbi:MAG: sulfotransferase [Rhodocyclaceae bacterium]|nr:sulfotransferase [Rhodocyclaceae bacterium]
MIDKKDVFILGTAYCGSTLLGNALNGHSRIAYAGEVSRLPGFDVGAPERLCPVCASQGKPCDVWSDEFCARMVARGPGRIFETYREAAADAPIVVDGSKSVNWFRKVMADSAKPDNPFVIVAVRNPFSFVDSCRRRDGYEAWLAANIWRDTVFDVLRTVAHHGLPHIVVRYEDLSRAPESTLKQICAFLSVSFEAGMLEFWTKPLHGLGGNAGAYVWFDSFRRHGQFSTKEDEQVAAEYASKAFGGWTDEKWCSQLDAAQRNTVVQTPMLPGMCSLVGYSLEDLISRASRDVPDSAKAA